MKKLLEYSRKARWYEGVNCRESSDNVTLLFQVPRLLLKLTDALTDAEQAIVAKASQDLYRYERICEEHSAVLRKDAEACIKAHQEYTANSPPMGFMPPRNEFDRYIKESENVLKKECRTVLEYATCKFGGVIVLIYFFCSHIHVVHAGFFLCRLLMTMVVEQHGERVYREFIRRKVELEYVLVF